MDDVQARFDGREPPEPAPRPAEGMSEAAGAVAETAMQQGRQVAEEVKVQVRSVAADLRDTVAEQARAQNDRLADTIRRLADDLDRMAENRTDSPAGALVSRVAEGGHQVADYLTKNGPEGVLAEVQDFARRRPGAFLAVALASGFVVGRLGKGVLSAGDRDARPLGAVSPAPRVPPARAVALGSEEPIEGGPR